MRTKLQTRQLIRCHGRGETDTAQLPADAPRAAEAALAAERDEIVRRNFPLLNITLQNPAARGKGGWRLPFSKAAGSFFPIIWERARFVARSARAGCRRSRPQFRRGCRTSRRALAVAAAAVAAAFVFLCPTSSNLFSTRRSFRFSAAILWPRSFLSSPSGPGTSSPTPGCRNFWGTNYRGLKAACP